MKSLEENTGTTRRRKKNPSQAMRPVLKSALQRALALQRRVESREAPRPPQPPSLGRPLACCAPWPKSDLDPLRLPASAIFQTYKEAGYDNYDVVDVSRVIKEGQIEGYLKTRRPTLILSAGIKPFRTLYTASVCFIDVDYDPAIPADQQRGPLLRRLRRFTDINPEFGFRCYQTAAGLRYLLTSHTLDTDDADLIPWAYSLGADPKYMRMVALQGMFAARLEPKPERCLELGVEYATTDYLWREGNTDIDPDAMTVLKYHDRVTRAHAELPLA